MTVRPELDELLVADPPEAWAALGFAVAGGVVALGGVRVRLGAPGASGAGEPAGGIVGWSLRGLAGGADLDGLPTAASGAGASGAPASEPGAHPNGALGIDHVVALTPDFDRTVTKLRGAGLDYRRTRDAGGGRRQAFFVMGSCLLELAGPAGDGPPRFWGLTLVVADLDETAAFLGDRLGPAKDAVQPGRRIATLRESAGLSVPLALMTPRR